MIFLTFIVCLISDPTVCQTIHAPPAFESVQECATEAQEYVSEWVGDHPKWRPKWPVTCGPKHVEGTPT